MEEDNQAQAVPRLCRKGCGFYGSPNYDGFCSKCHRDMRIQTGKNQLVHNPLSPKNIFKKNTIHHSEHILHIPRSEDTSDEPLAKEDTEKSTSLSSAKSPSTTSENFSASGSVEVTPKKPRCLTCNKRIGLTGFTCRCGGMFCAVHRYSDSHNCAFNYRESGRAAILKSNPRVICSKIDKI